MNKKEIKKIKKCKEFAKYNFYHYTSQEKFCEIINKKYFLINSLKNMNDANEANKYKNSDRMFALCFCNSNSENIPLWYLYAGIKGNGIRIGITPKNMLDFCKNINVYEYNNKKIADSPINKNDYEIMFGSIYYVNGSKAYYKNQWVKMNNNTKYFIKDYPWHYEKEFRIFLNIKGKRKAPEKLAIKFDEEFCKKFRIMLAPEFKNNKRIKNVNLKKFYSIQKSKLKINMNLFKRNENEIKEFYGEKISNI